MSITKELFGKTHNGEDAYIFTVKNSNGITAKLTNFGAILVALNTPDSNGNFADIVLGYDDFEGYLENPQNLGATIGRTGNRIKDAEFYINDIKYTLAKNDGENSLHGGLNNYKKVLWNSEIIETPDYDAVEFTYLSKDGEEGYPGNLNVKVTYSLTKDNSLKIDTEAVADKDTVVNIVNHSYFNLGGHDSGSIFNHKLQINADTFTPIAPDIIPTGELKKVEGTPMDFRTLSQISKMIDYNFEQIAFVNGYDHNWVLNTNGDISLLATKVLDEKTGRLMDIFTTKPGIQFYSGNFLDGAEKGKNGVAYQKGDGLCLETQYFPNAINCPSFPSPILKANEKYTHTTIYKFSTK
ncbi:aldose epimerase family protein [Clostridium cellulovorans]|uniref:Aldose 1-epimerase n=1 Tax=Clostridium cellulovorans (strain ATCC 35296 / DSM 3052 / OCM 3 / 743B) TaxID=573061 RepID=D9SUV2_CLOC7|nr:aldose epimerase family protein [Clostridium cellulovorans]ADL51007.1 Aldose 1-epimerase [Clostridium cellulovorans 743B]